MNIMALPALQQEQYLVKNIFKILKECGQPMTRTEIKEVLSDRDDDLAGFIKLERVSEKTHNTYHPFLFKFNFAIKNLVIAGLITSGEKIALTEKGINLSIAGFDIERDVYSISKEYWEQKHKEYLAEKEEEGDDSKLEKDNPQERYNEEIKEKLLDAISKMSPGKFETFSRALLSKMGVIFSNEEGISISNDGGIDGLGIYRDMNDFRTTKVVIQCKRFNANDVGSPDINGFIGAMDRKKANCGIFITNSRFTVAARKAAIEGTPITLIDGDELVKLIIKYELYLTPVQTYELMDFYSEEE